MSQEQSSIANKITNDDTIHTNYVLGGKTINAEAKNHLVTVLKYYVMNNITPDSPTETQKAFIKDITNFVLKNPNFTYDQLSKYLNTSSFEHTLAYLLVAFMTKQPTDPIHLLSSTYGRPLPVETMETWMDNFRINSLGYPTTMIVYKKYDVNNSPDVYSVNIPAPVSSEINKNIKLNWYRVYKFIVNPLRGILIQQKLYGNDKLRTPNNLSNEELERICDVCYLQYPIAYCGSHGCDVFNNEAQSDFENMSLTLDEIDKVLERYPKLHIEYVLNTAMYRSSSGGQHWVTVIFTHKKCMLICSQAGNFDIFDDNNYFLHWLDNKGYKREHNNISIQHDGFNCGIFSSLMLYMMPLYNWNITSAVTEGVGSNGSNLNKFATGTQSSDVDINTIKAKIIGTEEKN